MLPEIWGNYGWKFIHLITVAYPNNPTEDEKREHYDFFQTLKYVLPCTKCRYNLTHHLKKYPLTEEVLSCRKNFVKWGIDLHNVVNYYIGKPMLTYTEAMNEINKLVNPPTVDYTPVYYLLILIIVAIIGYLVYYHVKKLKK